MTLHLSPVEADAFAGAHSRRYLSAVFAAYREGQVVMALPRSAGDRIVPGVRVLERRSFEDDPGWFDEGFAPIGTNLPAQISFSSGTTGQPKAILLSHRALGDVTGRINAAMGVDAGIREYVGVPVTFSFGFGRVRAVAAAGGQSFLPARGFDPAEIARMLRAGEINAISAVPTLWRVVLGHPEIIGEAGRRVRWIEIGSQYMAGTEKAALKRLFPEARIVQHYGLTEASRTTLLDISETEGPALESVGRPTGRVEVAVGEGGAIRIRGPHLADGLVTEAGVVSLTDEAGWLTTSDRGRMEDGHLFYEGRLDELINCGGIKVDPARFEQRLAARLGVPGAVAVGRLADPLRGERVLVVTRRDADLPAERVAAEAAGVAEEVGLAAGGTLVFAAAESFPTTPTGKVQRNALAAFAAGLEGPVPDPAAAPVPPASAGEGAAAAEALQGIWAAALGISAVPLDQNFYDLGGDSLSALTAVLRLEAAGLDPEVARGVFDGKTIAEIAGLSAPEANLENSAAAATAGNNGPVGAEGGVAGGETGLRLPQAMNAIHATRGLLALWVVTVHWLPGVLARLPGTPVWLYEAIEPLVRFGTPGFALVFGMGLGALSIPQFRENPQRFREGLRLKQGLVLGGVVVMALMALGVAWTKGRLGNPNLLSAMFFSAIAFYALILLALPWLLRLLLAGPNVLLTILAAAVGSMAINELLAATILPLRPDGALELAKILLAAKYGFFRMTAYVLVGAAIGHLVRERHATPGLPGALVTAGATLFAFGLLVTYKVDPDILHSPFAQVLPWHLMVYAGAAVMLLGGFCRLNAGRELAAPLRLLNAGAIASGILSLPIFVGHEIVIPAKVLLAGVGVPGALALLLPLGLFGGLLLLGYARLLPVLGIRLPALRRGAGSRRLPA